MAAKALAAAGAKVVLTGRNEAKLAELTEGIVADGGEAIYLLGDPVVHDDVTRVVQGTVEKYGGIDILVTAAVSTPTHPSPSSPMTSGRWSWTRT